MNPLLLSQKNHYKAFFLKYCKLQLRAIYYFPWLAFCSGQRIQAKSGQKINSTALFACVTCERFILMMTMLKQERRQTIAETPQCLQH